MVEVTQHEDRHFASLGRFPEQFPTVAGGDTPLEAVAAAVDESHRAYGNALPQINAEADEDSYSTEQI